LARLFEESNIWAGHSGEHGFLLSILYTITCPHPQTPIFAGLRAGETQLLLRGRESVRHVHLDAMQFYTTFGVDWSARPMGSALHSDPINLDPDKHYLFHGTTLDGAASIMFDGISPSASQPGFKALGPGFYVCDSASAALRFALAKVVGGEGGRAVVLVFEFTPEEYAHFTTAPGVSNLEESPKWSTIAVNLNLDCFRRMHADPVHAGVDQRPAGPIGLIVSDRPQVDVLERPRHGHANPEHALGDRQTAPVSRNLAGIGQPMATRPGSRARKRAVGGFSAQIGSQLKTSPDRSRG
jgi:hypothetical protein